MPKDDLINYIVDSIHNFDINYEDFINYYNLSDDLMVLKSPSNDDKILLLETISTYFNKYRYVLKDRISLDGYLSVLSEVYNEHCIGYMNHKISFYNLLTFSEEEYVYRLGYLYNINLLRENEVNIIIDNHEKGTIMPEYLYRLVNLQLFIFASVWIDMDKLLLYLYNEFNPEAY